MYKPANILLLNLLFLLRFPSFKQSFSLNNFPLPCQWEMKSKWISWSSDVDKKMRDRISQPPCIYVYSTYYINKDMGSSWLGVLYLSVCIQIPIYGEGNYFPSPHHPMQRYPYTDFQCTHYILFIGNRFRAISHWRKEGQVIE